ncbi:hypothetical protein [Luteococcus sp. H101]|uniref:hypothetical protein n=1 Tax=Luteococcus sp. H101 TaxID=3139402 RepID=UPI00313DAFF5
MQDAGFGVSTATGVTAGMGALGMAVAGAGWPLLPFVGVGDGLGSAPRATVAGLAQMDVIPRIASAERLAR